MVAEGKEVREFDGEPYVMERGLHADLSLVKAWKGDAEGNLVYRLTARNFNAPMAVTRAAVLYVFRTLVDGDIPLNGGLGITYGDDYVYDPATGQVHSKRFPGI